MPARRMTIMLIEDDPLCLESLNQALILNGFDTLGFSSPLQALNSYTEQQVDAVITDYHLPEINGIRVLKEIKKKNPRAVVIIISADEKREISCRALHAGAFSFLFKPIDIGKIIDTLKKLS